MKPLTAKQIIVILKANGFILARQRGSHSIWRNPQLDIIVPAPLHGGNKVLPIGTFLAIVKQSKISKNQFK